MAELAEVRVKFDAAATQRWMRRPDGDVARFLFTKGLQVSNRAKLLVGVDEGELRRDIGLAPGEDVRGLYVDVGSSVEHALVHHEGSAPHIIVPKRPGGMLRFQMAGRTVFARIVRHPGTRGTHYLTRALEVLRR